MNSNLKMNCTPEFNVTVDDYMYDNGTFTTEDLEYWSTVLENSRYIVQRIFVPLVLSIGVIGNIITIAVLTRRHMQTSTNLYLTALAVSDMMYLALVFSLSLEHIPWIAHPDYLVYWHYYRYARWLTDAFSNTSTWLTITFTMERYIAVCHPIKGKVFCTQSRAKRVILVVYILCALFSATTPHESDVVYDPNSNCTTVTLVDSALGRHRTYKTWFYWFTAVAFILLPVVLLAIFNTMLIMAVKHSRERRSTMTGHHIPRESQASQENKITVMLIAVVLLAITCQMPTAAMLMYTSIVEVKPNTLRYYICRVLGNVFNLLTAVNAAVNFCFYCVLSDRYRRTFLQTFCPRWYRRRYSQPSWMATTGYTNFEDGSPRMSFRGSLRHSRRSSYRSNTSSSPRGSPSHASIKMFDRQSWSGASFLTVPPKSRATQDDSNDHTPTYGKRQARNGSLGCKFSIRETIPDEDQECSSRKLLSAEKTDSDSTETILRTTKKTSFKNIKDLFRTKSRPEIVKSKQNILITCQKPSQEEQTSV